MAEAGAAMIWCPFPDEEAAAQIAATLVEEKLVACANILGSVRSIFAWEGKTADSRECGVLFKTNAATLDAAIERLAELHPYDSPAIMGWPCQAAAPTSEWIEKLVVGGPS